VQVGQGQAIGGAMADSVRRADGRFPGPWSPAGIAIAVVVSQIPFAGYAVAGWAFLYTRKTSDEQGAPLPGWEGTPRFLGYGLAVAFSALPTAIIGLPLWFAFWRLVPHVVPPVLLSRHPDLQRAISYWLAAVIVSVPWLGGIALWARTGDLRSVYSWGKVARMIRERPSFFGAWAVPALLWTAELFYYSLVVRSHKPLLGSGNLALRQPMDWLVAGVLAVAYLLLGAHLLGRWVAGAQIPGAPEAASPPDEGPG
jgi:hypothetical protein